MPCSRTHSPSLTAPPCAPTPLRTEWGRLFLLNFPHWCSVASSETDQTCVQSCCTPLAPFTVLVSAFLQLLPPRALPSPRFPFALPRAQLGALVRVWGPHWVCERLGRAAAHPGDGAQDTPHHVLDDHLFFVSARRHVRPFPLPFYFPFCSATADGRSGGSPAGTRVAAPSGVARAHTPALQQQRAPASAGFLVTICFHPSLVLFEPR